MGSRAIPRETGFAGAARAARALIVCSVVALLSEQSAAAGPIVPGVGYEFGFTDARVSPIGCQPNDPAGIFCIPSSGHTDDVRRRAALDVRRGGASDAYCH